MRLAWVTHHLPRDDDAHDSPAHLPGRYAGGAEMTDEALILAMPDGVEVVRLAPKDWEQALDCDDIVVTGTDLLSDEALNALAWRAPAVFLHHLQPRRQMVGRLIDSSRVLILHTPAHEARERQWTSPRRVELVLSPVDPAGCVPGEKRDVAVWAQRWHDLKGPLQARWWAAKHGIPLQILVNQPRADVLAALSTARWYVHLPIGFESESRGTIEAVLSGCACVVNDNVGLTSVEGWDDRERLADLVAGAADRFWRVILA